MSSSNYLLSWFWLVLISWVSSVRALVSSVRVLVSSVRVLVSSGKGGGASTFYISTSGPIAVAEYGR